MGVPADVGVDGDGEAEFIVFSMEKVEMISPQVLNVSRVDPAMRVRRFLDELKDRISTKVYKTSRQHWYYHHWGQIIEIPVRWNFD